MAPTGHRFINNVSSLVGSIPQFDGTASIFPVWQSRLLDVLSLQGVLDVVDGSLPRPETPQETRSIEINNDKGYNPYESVEDWDLMSEAARSAIKLSLSAELSLRYKDVRPASKLYKDICNDYDKVTRNRRVRYQDRFWLAKHDPSKPIDVWINHMKAAAADLARIKIGVSDAQLTDRLIQQLDESWSSLRNQLLFEPVDVSLEEAVDAFQAHELSLAHVGLVTNPHEPVPTSVLTDSNSQVVGSSTSEQMGHDEHQALNLATPGSSEASPVPRNSETIMKEVRRVCLDESELGSLASTAEPGRAVQWMKRVFEPCAEAHVPQVVLWLAYKTQFEKTGVTLLQPAEAVKLTTNVFPSALPRLVSNAGEREFTIEGLRPRKRIKLEK